MEIMRRVSEAGAEPPENHQNDMEEKSLLFVLKHYRPGWPDVKSGREKIESRIPGLKRNRSAMMMRWCSGAAAAVLLFIGIALHQGSRRQTYLAYDVVQSFVLPDSSRVTLAPGATVSLRPHRFKSSRQIEMTGKVFFEVRRDERHPFEINAEGAFVRVLGTRFQVDRTEASTTVSVVSGKVLFSSGTRESDAGLVLAGGMTATLAEGSVTPALTNTGDINQTAWATGKFVYSNAPLSSVLSDLSAYWHRELAVVDGDAEERYITGEFDASDMGKVIRLIDSALDVRIVVR